MRSDLIRRHLPIRHKCQRDIDHIIGQLATVEKALGTRVVIRQDIWQQNIRNCIGLGSTVTKGRQVWPENSPRRATDLGADQSELNVFLALPWLNTVLIAGRPIRSSLV